MNTPNRFICPHCGFRIFNRRRETCESCGQSLPAELMLNAQQRQFMEVEDRRIEKVRKDLATKAAEEERKRQVRRGDGG